MDELTHALDAFGPWDWACVGANLTAAVLGFFGLRCWRGMPGLSSPLPVSASNAALGVVTGVMAFTVVFGLVLAAAAPAFAPAPEGFVNVLVDGKHAVVPKGDNLIEAARKVQVEIPYFCYHPRLSIAGQCRLCLVETSDMPGRLVAGCQVRVKEGLQIITTTSAVKENQRAVMEFHLVNHPVDCPICDQGGECELQDVSMGYGRSVSRYVDRKRVVPDEDMGPLVATDMTRCIQCTRCVRFSAEIAGTYELGGIYRGENLQIGTFDGKPLMSEISGNVIDVCPVGALTNKVFRYKARAWELTAKESLGYHDALGSNIYLHSRRGEVLRAVPRDNEAVNECWLSDRDRYSHEGLYSSDRATQPMLKENGHWRVAAWDEALAAAVAVLKSATVAETGVLVHPASSNEEGFRNYHERCSWLY